MTKKIENPEDIVGSKFTYLNVIKYLGYYRKTEKGAKTHHYLCICDCDKKEFIATRYHLQTGKVKSCGCLKTERIKRMKLKHGLHGTRPYASYRNMIERCYNKNNEAYVNYGGRGIKVCSEWLDDFMNFYNWAMENGYEDHLTIDRINNDGDYEPKNCRWATSLEQNSNTRKNRKFKAIDSNGLEYFHSNQTEFARIHNLNRTRINQCLNNKKHSHKGWTFEYLEESRIKENDVNE